MTMDEQKIRADERDRCFKAIMKLQFGPPSSWATPGRPMRWHLERDCTPTDAAMHDNGVREALKAIRHAVGEGA